MDPQHDSEGTPFAVHDVDGKHYLLTPLYRHHGAGRGQPEAESPAECVGFRTDVAQEVVQDGEDHYLILDTDPAVILVADEPAASEAGSAV